jgi:hypothetical protein
MPLVITNENIGKSDGSAILVKYDNLTQTDLNPAPIEWAEWADKSVQVIGTFGGGTIVIEGSNDGINWVTLTDPQGNAISKTTAFVEQIMEVTRYVRPRVTSGTGVDLDAFFVLRRNQGMRS